MKEERNLELVQKSAVSKSIKVTVTIIAIIWSLFQIGVAIYPIATNSLLAIHLSFGLAIGHLVHPLKKKANVLR